MAGEVVVGCLVGCLMGCLMGSLMGCLMGNVERGEEVVEQGKGWVV